MNGMDSRSVLGEALDYLMALQRDGIRPQEARTRLHRVAERYPNLDLDLVWEEEAYDLSVHYDLLLRQEGQGTISLSFCPASTLPWPLRGVHRWHDQDLVRVNNTVLRMDDAAAYLDVVWNDVRILRRLVNVCLIREALERAPVDVSGAERQEAMDAFRRTHRLYSSEATYAWMKENGITHTKLEQLASEQAKLAKLRDRIVAGRVEAYFEEHHADFDSATIARIDVGERAAADSLLKQLRAGPAEFYEAAEQLFLAGAGRRTTVRGLFEVMRRGEVPREMAESVFAAQPGDLVGPVETNAGYSLIRVLSILPATLDSVTEALVKQRLFEEWLAEQRRAARIEWFWGRVDRTSQVA